VGRDLEALDFFDLSPTRNVVFGYFTIKNMRAARLSPSPTRKLRPDVSHGTVMSRIFWSEKIGFFYTTTDMRLG
jgi:hypothetical protein